MTAEQIQAALQAVDPQHPLYLAFQALLDNAVETEQDNVTLPNLTDGGRQFNAGRLAQAKDFRSYVRDEFRKAHEAMARELLKADAAARRAQTAKE